MAVDRVLKNITLEFNEPASITSNKTKVPAREGSAWEEAFLCLLEGFSCCQSMSTDYTNISAVVILHFAGLDIKDCLQLPCSSLLSVALIKVMIKRNSGEERLTG